ncbi:MAG: uracil phosphoribosyltransferase [Flavobacteriaceae bacterium]|jgi:Ca2+-dependent lipid-binding protein|nr:uracil phosphoribosyltransferase [Flavobacteriaceae bacterium]
MEVKDIFYGIQDLFEDVLFIPFDALRMLELESWFAANIMSWIFMLIGFVAFLYWMNELKKYNENNEEDRTSTSHAYLGSKDVN